MHHLSEAHPGALIGAPAPPSCIRIVLVASVRLYRDGLAAALAERAGFVKRVLGGRDAELNLMVHFVRITDDRRTALETAHRLVPHLGVEELGSLATVLVGSAEAVAEHLLRTRETLGASYFTVLEDDLTRLAPVIERLR